MSTTITVEEAQAKLPELIAKLAPGEAVVITQNDQPWPNCTRSPGRSHGQSLVAARGCLRLWPRMRNTWRISKSTCHEGAARHAYVSMVRAGAESGPLDK